MIKKHLKRLVAPTTWPIRRKGIKYTTRVDSGKKVEYSLSLTAVLRDLIKITKTAREGKYLLHEKEVVVDGKKRNERRFPVGLFDVISFPEVDEHYRLVLSEKGKLKTVKIDKKESVIKISKIIGKSKIKNKTQINLIDSRNVIVEKDDYKVGDSVVLKIPEQEITNTIKLEKGAYVLLTSGKHIGSLGVLEDVSAKNIIMNLEDGKKVETLRKYAYAVGKGKPEIKLSD